MINRLNDIFLSTLLLIGLTFILVSCDDAPEVSEDNYDYAFVTAGHTYGTAGIDNDGLHPYFEDQFSFLNDFQNLDLCFLTGDVVIATTEKNWQEVDSVLENLQAEVHVAPGSHDLTDIDLYESIRGERYYNFKHKGDLYVILEPASQGWKILDDQKEMLMNALEEHKTTNGFTFVFFHNLLWYEVDNKYNACKPNSTFQKEGISNFLPEIVPFLQEMPNDVAVYAGDIGGWPDSCSVMYDHFDNVHFIASGMGGKQKDNIVITKIYGTDSIGFEVIALQNERNSLGILQDYWIQ